MRLTVEDIQLTVAALDRAISRYESEVRYAKSGRGANNPKTVAAKANKLKDLRDRMLQSSGIVVVEG